MTLLAIALANGVLLYGLFALGWSPGTVAFLFWYEAALAGVLTLVKVAACVPGAEAGEGRTVTYVRMPKPGARARVSSTVPGVAPVTAVPLFVLFYGSLLAGYGALLLLSLQDGHYSTLVQAALSADGVPLTMAVLAAEHGWMFWRGFVRAPAWQRRDPTFHFWKPFGLAFVMYLAFFFGFLLLGWLHSPLTVLTPLILLKALAELFNALVDAQAGEWQRKERADA